ncbi:replication endonuclease, partial [Escherichia coli]|nr:replication endonuclease [Escherichia coli]
PEERPAPWPQLPDGVEVNEWMRSLKRHERRALMRSLREKPVNTSSGDTPDRMAGHKQPPDIPVSPATEWRKSAGEPGIKLSDEHIQHLMKTGMLRINGHVLEVTDGRLTHRRDQRTDRKVSRIWERLSRNHGISTSEIRYNPLAHYVDMLRNIGVEALPAVTEHRHQGDESQ